MRTILHKRGTTFDKTIPLTGPASYFTSYSLTLRKVLPTQDVPNDTDGDVIGTATSGSGLTPDGTTLRVQFSAAVAKFWPDKFYGQVKGHGRSGDADFVADVETFEVKLTRDVNRGTPSTP